MFKPFVPSIRSKYTSRIETIDSMDVAYAIFLKERAEKNGTAPPEKRKPGRPRKIPTP